MHRVIHRAGAFLLLSALFVLLVFQSACTPQEPRADLVILNGAEPESLDPAVVTGQADLRATGALFEGLTRNDPRDGVPTPALAERWDVSPDGMVYTFYLRTNAVWSTGTLITTADVVYSWLRVLNPYTAGDYASQLFPIKNAAEYNRGAITNAVLVGVKALSPQVLRVELRRPTPYFLDLCACPTMAVVPHQTIEVYKDRWLLAKPLPVSGPYLLESWRVNDKIRLRKNPLYWDAANTQNNCVDLLPVGSAVTALDLYLTGAADIVWDKELAPAELLDTLLKRPDFHTFDYLGVYFFRINVTRKPFDDPRVRRALALAIDKQRLVEKITAAGEKPASQITPPIIPNYHPPEGLGRDPEAARRLLADAGYPGGAGFPTFTYMFNAAAGGSAKMHQKIAVELQQMWARELGLHMELRQVEWKALLAAQSSLDYDMCRSSWVGDYNDPNTFLDLFLSDNGNNRTGWKNAAYDALLDQAGMQADPIAREKLLQKAEALLVREELPMVPLFFYKGISYYDGTKITGIYPNVIDQHPINAIRRIR
jgi:oligopeptide transport system substrate-binding protein